MNENENFLCPDESGQNLDAGQRLVVVGGGWCDGGRQINRIVKVTHTELLEAGVV